MTCQVTTSSLLVGTNQNQGHYPFGLANEANRSQRIRAGHWADGGRGGKPEFMSQLYLKTEGWVYVGEASPIH